PLSWIRAGGWLFGWTLYALVTSRRRVVHTNLAMCFPELSQSQRTRLARQSFIYFAQAWLDRAWVWHAPREKVLRRVSLTGAVGELAGHQPTVIFVPHFVGMDAALPAACHLPPRMSATIYTDQSNKLVDRWIFRGRQRFGNLRLFGRIDGVRPIIAALRRGEPLYLLPDMDFGREDSVFVPFFGIPTATVPSLARFAALGRAKVVTALSRMTPHGYEIEILPAWANFPTDDAVADTALMNARLQEYIRTMPAQYYWVHKRFKTRPDGEASLY
ncbi:MAG: lipid biosynthesis acyltransferase, partial [Polaromonas sp.]|nr:lipid biosynthesis acyltransferase [Polaromonas sp.]